MAQLNFTTQKKHIGYLKSDKYVSSVVRYSTFTTKELIDIASENSGIPKAQMSSALYALLQQVQQFVLNGHAIQLGDMGTLYVSSNAKAADSEKEAGASSIYRLSLRFRQSKHIRNLINNSVSLNSLDNDEDDEAENDSNSGGSEPQTVTVEVKASPAQGGTVSGSGTYNIGEEVNISASAASGYVFSAWNDGGQNASRTVTATQDVTYTATFVTDSGAGGDEENGGSLVG